MREMQRAGEGCPSAQGDEREGRLCDLQFVHVELIFFRPARSSALGHLVIGKLGQEPVLLRKPTKTAYGAVLKTKQLTDWPNRQQNRLVRTQGLQAEGQRDVLDVTVCPPASHCTLDLGKVAPGEPPSVFESRVAWQ